MNIPIEFEQECGLCDGRGKVHGNYIPSLKPGDTCPRCNGTGWDITDHGHALLAFLERHGGEVAVKLIAKAQGVA